jgi:hypothetical protein
MMRFKKGGDRKASLRGAAGGASHVDSDGTPEGQMTELFHSFDDGGLGRLSHDALFAGLTSLGMPLAEDATKMAQLWLLFDPANEGFVTLQRFQVALAQMLAPPAEETMVEEDPEQLDARSVSTASSGSWRRRYALASSVCPQAMWHCGTRAVRLSWRSGGLCNCRVMCAWWQAEQFADVHSGTDGRG